MNSENAVDASESTEQTSSNSVKTPWHLWVVGIIGLLWNSMGVLDFVMTITKNEQYMSAFTEEQLEFFYGFPSWLVVFWAIAVIGGLVGIILLLCRSKLAVPVFMASFVSMVITAIHNYGFDKMYELTGPGGAIFTAVIFLISLFLVWYSTSLKGKGVLR